MLTQLKRLSLTVLFLMTLSVGAQDTVKSYFEPILRTGQTPNLSQQALARTDLGIEAVITATDPAATAGTISTGRPVVIGKAGPNSLVSIYVGGALKASGFANASGTFNITLPFLLDGTYEVRAFFSPASAPYPITISDPLQPMVNAQSEPAIIDCSTVDGIYWANGVKYASKSDLVSALSGSLTGDNFSIGPYVDPNGYEYLPNGTFDTDVSGWTTTGGNVIEWASGEMYVSTGVGSGSVYRSVVGFAGRAFAFTGTGRRGTNSTNSPQIAATTQSGTFPGNVSAGTPVTSTDTTSTVYISSRNGSNTWFGVRYSTGAGTTYWDNFSVREVMPMPGWTSFAVGDTAAGIPAWTMYSEAVTPSSLPSSGQVAVPFQADANQERDRVRVYLDETGAVKLLLTNNAGVSADLTLGTTTVSTAIKVSASISKGTNAVGSGITGSLNGANRVVNQTASLGTPGVSHLRYGFNATGTSAWGGTIRRMTVLKRYQASDWVENVTAPSGSLWFEGDSYVAGAGGVVLGDKLETAVSKKVIISAEGGSTLAEIVSRILARDYLRSRTLIVWDGSANGFIDVPTALAYYRQVATWKGNGKYLFIPSINCPNPAGVSTATPSDYTLSLRALRDAMITEFGASHVCDVLPILQTLGNGSGNDNNDIAAGLPPRSILLTQNANEVHLSHAAMDAVAGWSVFQNKITNLPP